MANITIAAMTAKGAPATGDLIEIADSGAANATKKATLGTLPVSTAQQTALDGKAAASHAHSGADLTSGTVPVARIGTGTKDTTTFYRGDGTFAVPAGGGGGATNLTNTPAPTGVAVNSSTGTGTTLPAGDATNAGLILPAQVTKLAGVATGATANSADATLLARANHTGTQLAATISDLTTTVQATPLPPTVAASLGTATAQVQRYVTDGALRGPYIWVPSSQWVDLLGGRADPRFFGAKVDGTTDDTAAYQAALDAMGTLSLPGFKFQSNTGVFQGGATAPGGGLLLIPPGVSVVGPLVLRHRAAIEGGGRGSVLRQKAATTGPLLSNQFDGTLRAGYANLRRFTIDGNKANQSAANRGILLTGDTTNNYTSAVSEDYDMVGVIDDVSIFNTKGDGLALLGAGGHFVTKVKTLRCDGYGFLVAQDSKLSDCDAGWSGLAGFRLGDKGGGIGGDGSNLDGCKSWYSGQITNTEGFGFKVNNDSSRLVNCEAQDNQRSGFDFDNCNNVVAQGLVADQNDAIGYGDPGFSLYSSKGCLIEGVARNRYQSGTNPVGQQETAIAVKGGSTGNVVNIMAQPIASGYGTQNLVSGDSDKVNNVISVNGARQT